MKVSCMQTMDFNDHIAPFLVVRSLEGWQSSYQRGLCLKTLAKSVSVIFQTGKINPVPCHCLSSHFLVWAILGGTRSLPHATASSGKCHHDLISYVPRIPCEKDSYAFEGLIQYFQTQSKQSRSQSPSREDFNYSINAFRLHWHQCLSGQQRVVCIPRRGMFWNSAQNISWGHNHHHSGPLTFSDSHSQKLVYTILSSFA